MFLTKRRLVGYGSVSSSTHSQTSCGQWALRHMQRLTESFRKSAKSIQNAALNFLTAVSLFNNGVREILPFVYVYAL